MTGFSSYNHKQHCSCGQVVFFDNSICLRCGSALAFHPEQGRLHSLLPAEEAGRWVLYQEVNSAREVIDTYRRCANVDSPAQCNWLVTGELDQNADSDLCLACATNVTIPDLTQSGNPDYWRLCEVAKRRLIAQLLMLNLPVKTRQMDPDQGLGFELLRWRPGEETVVTGHKGGVITLDIAEADPAFREQIRQQMQEPYRTLLGHFRHESGHYYWDRLVRNSNWLPLYRQLFGDERRDYQKALEKHYQSGPPPDWQSHYISSYAATHPWEDWAETWAHYLHMTDTLSAAEQFGIDADGLSVQMDPFTPEQLDDCPFQIDAERGTHPFLGMVNRWVRLSSVLNMLARSMGQPDSYPFVLTLQTLRKMYLVHAVIA
ncbi:MAG: putative zinc-binding metallopeptidase [Pseudomonadales bacterium]|nr:putative zinc-binding metallopeptidase [Pseudomonadales bacterium]